MQRRLTTEDTEGTEEVTERDKDGLTTDCTECAGTDKWAGPGSGRAFRLWQLKDSSWTWN